MKTLDSVFVTALTTGPVRPRFFLDLNLDPALRYWTGRGDKVLDGNTYSGNGYIKGIGRLEAFDATEDGDMTVSLAGEVSSIITLVQASTQRLQQATVYFALVDDDGDIIAYDTWFNGYLHNADFEISPTECRLDLLFSSMWRSENDDNELRYSHELHQAIYPGDLFFEYLPQIEDWSGYWGKAKDSKVSKAGKGDRRGQGGKKREKEGSNAKRSNAHKAKNQDRRKPRI